MTPVAVWGELYTDSVYWVTSCWRRSQHHSRQSLGNSKNTVLSVYLYWMNILMNYAYRRHLFFPLRAWAVYASAQVQGIFQIPTFACRRYRRTQDNYKRGMDRGKGPMQIGFVFCRDYVKTYILRFPVLSLDYSVKKNAREQVLLVITLGKASRIFYRVLVSDGNQWPTTAKYRLGQLEMIKTSLQG